MTESSPNWTFSLKIINFLHILISLYSLFICTWFYLQDYFAFRRNLISLIIYVIPGLNILNFFRSKNSLQAPPLQLPIFSNIIALLGNGVLIWILTLLLDYGHLIEIIFFMIYLGILTGLIWVLIMQWNRFRLRKQIESQSYPPNFSLTSTQLKDLESLLKESPQIQIADLASHLQLKEEILYKYLFLWAEKYQFRIKGKKILYKLENINSFIQNLDAMFHQWDHQSDSKKLG